MQPLRERGSEKCEAESHSNPTGFLRCRCDEDEDEHSEGCPCHFRLRTPHRDAVRRDEGATAEQLRCLGITTENHAFVGIPHIHVSQPGPKDTMHVFLEGTTRHFAAYVMYMIHHKQGASVKQVRPMHDRPCNVIPT